MTMTDPIADMLARLRNANSAYHETVAMPSSSVKARIAEILKQEGVFFPSPIYSSIMYRSGNKSTGYSVIIE